MKKFNQGTAFRVYYSALALVFGWFFSYFIATLVCGGVALSALEWASVTGIAVAVCALTWVAITVNMQRYYLSADSSTLVFRRGWKEKSVAIADVVDCGTKRIAFGRTILTVRTTADVYRAILRSDDVAGVLALLPQRQGAEDVTVLSFTAAERLKTLWVRLTSVVAVLTVAVLLVISAVWAYFSAPAALLALKVMLVAAGVALVCVAIEYAVREWLYAGFRLEIDGDVLRRIGRFGAYECRLDCVDGMSIKENACSVLFGCKKVKLCTRTDANGADQMFLPYYLGEDEVALLQQKLSLVPGETSHSKATDVLPLATTLLLYWIPVVILAAMYHYVFAAWLVPAILVVVNHRFAARMSVGDVICFSRGYVGKTTVVFRADRLCKIDTAAGLCARIYRKVNLKFYLPGATSVFYTGSTNRGYYEEIEQILQKKVDFEK